MRAERSNHTGWPAGTTHMPTSMSVDRLLIVDIGFPPASCNFNGDSVCNLADFQKTYEDRGYDLVGGVSARV